MPHKRFSEALGSQIPTVQCLAPFLGGRAHTVGKSLFQGPVHGFHLLLLLLQLAKAGQHLAVLAEVVLKERVDVSHPRELLWRHARHALLTLALFSFSISVASKLSDEYLEVNLKPGHFLLQPLSLSLSLLSDHLKLSCSSLQL